MTFNFVTVRRALLFIGSRRFSALCRRRFKEGQTRATFTTHQALQFAFCDWMAHIDSLNQADIQDIVLDYIGDDFWSEFATELEQKPRTSWPSVTICFAGGSRYVLLEGRKRWYDIEKDEQPAELPKRPVTMILCDLTALWAETIDRLEKLGGPRAELEHHPAAEQGEGSGEGMGRPG